MDTYDFWRGGGVWEGSSFEISSNLKLLIFSVSVNIWDLCGFGVRVGALPVLRFVLLKLASNLQPT